MSKDTYETFDSGGGPTIPPKSKEDFAHNDSGSKLGDGPGEGGAEHGAIPTIPQKK